MTTITNFGYLFVYAVIHTALVLQHSYEYAFYQTTREFDDTMIHAIYCVGFLVTTFPSVLSLVNSFGRAHLLLALLGAALATSMKESDSIFVLLASRALFVTSQSIICAIMNKSSYSGPFELGILVIDTACVAIGIFVSVFIAYILSMNLITIYRVSNVLLVLGFVVVPLIRFPLPRTAQRQHFSVITAGIVCWVDWLHLLVDMLWTPMITRPMGTDAGIYYSVLANCHVTGSFVDFFYRHIRFATRSIMLFGIGAILMGSAISAHAAQPDGSAALLNLTALAFIYFGIGLLKSILAYISYNSGDNTAPKYATTTGMLGVLVTTVISACGAALFLVMEEFPERGSLKTLMIVSLVLGALAFVCTWRLRPSRIRLQEKKPCQKLQFTERYERFSGI